MTVVDVVCFMCSHYRRTHDSSKMFLIRLLLVAACVAFSQQNEQHVVHQQTMTGGRGAVDVTDDIKALATKAVNEAHNAVSNDAAHYVQAGVLKAESQVVSGQMQHLHVLLRESTCPKTDAHASTHECTPKSNGKTLLCYFTVWTQSWRDFEEIKCKGCQEVKFVESDGAHAATGHDHAAASPHDAHAADSNAVNSFIW